MNILFYHQNRFIRGEMQEFLGELEGQTHFADTTKSAITILNTHSIDVAFVEVRGLSDISLVNYINRYFFGLRIVLLVENEFEAVISAIREGRYEMLRGSLGLGEIGRCLYGADAERLTGE